MVKVGRQAGRQAEQQILLLVETRLGLLGFGGVMDLVVVFPALML